MVRYMGTHEIPSPDGFRKMLDLPADPEAVLRDVLSRDEFAESIIQSLVDRFNEALISAIQEAVAWISKHWPKFDPLPESYEIFWTLMGIAFYVTILGLGVTGMVLLFKHVILPRWRRSGTVASEEPVEAEDQAPGLMPSREAALALALGGQYRDALMVLFRFVLVRLQDHGVVRLHPSWTNREILEQISPAHVIRPPLTELTTQFNAVRYGGMPCGKTDFDRCLVLAEELTRGS